MPKRTSDHHSWLLRQLTNPIVAANYLNAASSDSPDMFLVALRNVAEAHKMAKVAGEAGVAREALYRALSEEGNPRFDTLGAILKAVGLRIAVEAVGGPISPLGRSSVSSISGTYQTDQVKTSYRLANVRRIFGFLSKSTFQRSEDPALFQLQSGEKTNWTTGRIRISQPPTGDTQFTQTRAVGTASGIAIVASSKSAANETAQSRRTEIGSALSCAF
jgi:probable addiction module antidote protein